MRIREFKYKPDIPPTDLVYTIETTSSNQIVESVSRHVNNVGMLPIIDWGDGSGPVQLTSTSDYTENNHTYVNPGTYTIRITLQEITNTIYFGTNAKGSSLKSLDQWGGWARLGDLGFYNCQNLVAVNDGNLKYCHGGSLFRFCYALTTIPDTFTCTFETALKMFDNTNFTTMEMLTNWDFSQVTSVERMFYDMPNLTTIPLLSFPNATNSSYMFWNDQSLVTVPALDLSNMTDCRHMFVNCYALSNFPAFDFSSCLDLNSAFKNAFDINANVVVPSNSTTGNVTDWTDTFRNTKIYEMGTWNHSGTTSLPSTYYDCYAVIWQQQDLSTIENLSWSYRYCSRVTDFPNGFIMNTTTNVFTEATWAQCDVLATFPMIDTSMVTDFRATWYRNPMLDNFPGISVANATEFISTWGYCTSLATIGLIDTSTITNFGVDAVYGFWEGVFQNTALSAPPPWDYSNVVSSEYQFAECFNMTSFPDSFDMPNCTSCYGLFSGAAITTVTATSPLRLLPDLSYMFNSCGNLTSFPLWDLSNKTSIAGFLRNTNLTTFPDFNTSGTTNMGAFFAFCSDLTAYPNIDTSSNTNFSEFFESNQLTTMPSYDFSAGTNFSQFCFYAKFTTINLTLPQALDMGSAFAYMSNLTSVTLSTPLATDYDGICEGSGSLNSFSSTDVSNVTIMRDAFRYSGFAGETFPTLNLSAMTDAYGMFDFSYIDTQSCTDLIIWLEANNASSNVTLGLGTSNYYTAQAGTAVANLEARGWTVFSNGGI
jgi:hypothetical protein